MHNSRRALFALLVSPGCGRPSDWVHVDVGWNILCAEHASGTWDCFGKDGDSPPPSSQYLHVRANFDTACGVRASDGGVECWPDKRDTPIPAGTFVSVIGGTDAGFLCAIDQLGAVSCADVNGAMFSPGFEQPFAAADGYAQQLVGLTAAGTAVAAAPHEPDLETLSDGRPVQFVSFNSAFPFWLYEDGSMHTAFLDYEPQGAVQADGGWDYACMIDAEHVLTCFGAGNREGDLPPEGEFDVVHMFEQNTCAIRTNGKLVCWGKNFDSWETLDGWAERWHE